MLLYHEIYHKKNLNKNGRKITREAVRGIVINDRKVLMIYSGKNGDYKFPGGGIKEGESYTEALIREFREECGALISRIGKNIGKVIEYNKPIEEDYDVFIMISHYYLCEVDEGKHCEQNLDQYEKELDFIPVWIDIDEAINNNKFFIKSKSIETPRWTGRDTYVLDFIKDNIME
ncbi:MAG: NUDIX hydrolase [Halanaerobiales bacterium]